MANPMPELTLSPSQGSMNSAIESAGELDEPEVLFTDDICTVKKGFAVFPSPAGMSLTKLFLDGNMFPLLSLKSSLFQARILTESF
jgi:hypothetical protein